MAIQTAYGGKPHVEILPMGEPSSTCDRIARAIHEKGFNVIVLPKPQQVLWRAES